MRRDPRAYLWDAIQAADLVMEFTRNQTIEEYRDDVLRRSGVERQLEIVGEALNQLSRVDPGLSSRIPELAGIVGLRNILVHGYAAVDDVRVWQIVQGRLPALRTVLRALLTELDG